MHHHHPLSSAAPNAVTASASAATAATSSAANNGGSNATHAQQRRRKKRPNYGTRTVEVRRGYNGFGFTISGQQPCRLSCIVTNSPADQAGLRAGDFLISVNGLNVSKLPHETVVQLIGNSFGSIRMQIAENYYSDSSDEENAALMLQQQGAAGGVGVLSGQMGLAGVSGGVRAKPRYLHHKTKMHRLRNSPQKKRNAIVQQQQQMLQQQTQMQRAVQMSHCASILKPMELQTLRPLMEDLPLPQANKCHAPSMPSKTPLASSDVANVSAMVRVPTAALEYRAIVGYLGTIEMPKQISHSSKLQTVRSCIRKLRQEKRQPTTVLMTILPDCLRLQSANGSTLASYASERLNYVSSSSESENRFFGLVTSAVHTSQVDEEEEDEEENEESLDQPAASSGTGHISISNSCHVFVVDTKMVEHQTHMPRAAEFRIHCTRDPISNLCLEFPNNSEYVVNLIRSMYTMRILPPASRHAVDDFQNANGQAGGGGPAAAAHSPQPSNHSEISTTTSNSDSGIGFHNDCTNISDRILVVDFPGAAELRMRPIGVRPVGIFNNFDAIADKRLTVRAMPDPKTPPTAAAAHSHLHAHAHAHAHAAQTRPPNLLANFNLIKSPANSLTTTRSCDDVLALVQRTQAAELAEEQQQLLVPHASMDDISLHSATAASASTMTCSDDHLFLHPATCNSATQKLRATATPTYSLLQDCRTGLARNARQSLGAGGVPDKLSPQVFGVSATANAHTTSSQMHIVPPATTRHSLGFQAIDNTAPIAPLPASFDLDTWKSLQDLRAATEEELSPAQTVRATDGVISEPHLLNPTLSANASPLRRAWVQSSFRTPRTDKHAHAHLQPPESHSHQQLSPLVRRAASMTASDNDVYIKSIHRGYVDELKQMRSQQQKIATVLATNGNNKASASDNHINSVVTTLKVPQIKTEPPAPTTTASAVSQPPAVSGVAGWGSSFERLLEDPAGLHTFAEFLKKEFSAENIYFWTACERFRHLTSNSERATQAMAIFSKHLANGALEPVNVDSQARNLTQEKLQSAEPDIFAHAQKQIFNLMKFDSYQRFIRSELYKSCLEAEEKRQPLPYSAETLDELLKTHNQPPANSTVSKLKKSASNAEDRCRKSLLPWHRKTSGSKSRDRLDGENEKGHDKSKLAPLSSHSLKLPSTQNSLSDIHSSRSSLSSFEGLTGASIVPGTCRVILSDASTTVVQTRAGETVAQLVDRLLEKRGLSYQYYDVVPKGSTKSIDLQSSAEALVGKEVLIEQRVAFKLDLPDRKVISVKSKPKKQLYEVIRPILHKYNYDMEAVQVLLRETQAPLDLAQAVTVADGQRLQTVWLKQPPLLSADSQYGVRNLAKAALPKSVSFPSAPKLAASMCSGAAIRNGVSVLPTNTAQSTLDEITNKVFNELMQGKVEAQNEKQQLSKAADLCSLKSDDCASETSSIFERIRRRDSSIPGLKLKLKKKSTSSQHSEETNQSSSMNTSTAATMCTQAATNVDVKKPIIAKLKAGVKLQVTERVAENQDELLEGLKRAQLARLEDQRGTEINFELPDFLKNKENLNAAASKLRKVRANLRTYPSTAEEPPQSPISPLSSPPASERPQPAPRLSITNKSKVVPISPMKVDEESTFETNIPQTPTADTSNSSLEIEYAGGCKGPPPLPPKPKVLPIKPSNWGVNAQTPMATTPSPTTYKSYSAVATMALVEAETHAGKMANDVNRKSLLGTAEQQARCAYLEEPSSSFV